ncbi:MAG: hypothetical protein Q7R72_02700 [bacterium]|nr:hypothetical protein [bacterium]
MKKMMRNVMHSFVEQAEARIARELSEFEIYPGEIPYINVGAIVGRAMDFLRVNKVPIRGYVIDIHVLLVHTRSPNDDVSMKIDIGAHSSRTDQEKSLRDAIARFEAQYGSITKQEIVHKVQFLYDESQISD